MLDDIRQTWLLRARRKLFGYSYGLCGDLADAEDLYQDTFVRAVSAQSVPGEAVAYRVWLFRIMRNLWIDRLRAQGRMPDFDDAIEIDDLPSGHPEDQLVNALAVRQSFGNLSKAHREILSLVDICGFSYAEAADTLELPLGTIMSRLSRARTALAAQMQQEQNVISFPLRRAGRVGRM